MLEQVYGSAWHLPAVTLLSISILFIAMARKVPFIVGITVVFGWLIFLDAWVDGALTPVPTTIRTPFAILFAVLGDWRFFVLFERYSKGSIALRGWVISMVLACVTPLVGLVLL